VSEPATQQRPWWKLHASSYVFAVLAFLGFVFVNVPGQEVTQLETDYIPTFESKFEHGWPATYLKRGFYYFDNSLENSNNCWLLARAVESFSAWNLTENMAVALAGTCLGAAVFEFWRRRRKRVWQFTLADFFVGLAVLGVPFAWLGLQVQEYNKEQQALQQIRKAVAATEFIGGYEPSETIEYQHGAPTFLREIFGDGPFRFMDRVVHCDFVGSYCPEVAGQFLHLKYYSAYPIGPQAVASINRLKKLESLRLIGFPEPYSAAEWPGGAYFRGITPSPTLRYCDVSFATLTEEELKWLSRCRNLDHLSICTPSDRGLNPLRSLVHLKHVYLSSPADSPGFTDESLAILSRFPELEHLGIAGGHFSAAGIAQLKRNERLSFLRLTCRNIDAKQRREVIAGLAELPQVKHLSITLGSLDQESLDELAKLKFLKRLELAIADLDEAAGRQLKTHMPGTDVGRLNQ
jgi:hypothetical protein